MSYTYKGSDYVEKLGSRLKGSVSGGFGTGEGEGRSEEGNLERIEIGLRSICEADSREQVNLLPAQCLIH